MISFLFQSCIKTNENLMQSFQTLINCKLEKKKKKCRSELHTRIYGFVAAQTVEGVILELVLFWGHSLFALLFCTGALYFTHLKTSIFQSI